MANVWQSVANIPSGLTPGTMMLLTDGSVFVHHAYGQNRYRLGQSTPMATIPTDRTRSSSTPAAQLAVTSPTSRPRRISTDEMKGDRDG